MPHAFGDSGLVAPYLQSAEYRAIVEQVGEAVGTLGTYHATQLLLAIAGDFWSGLQERNVRRADVNAAADALRSAIEMVKSVPFDLNG